MRFNVLITLEWRRERQVRQVLPGIAQSRALRWPEPKGTPSSVSATGYTDEHNPGPAAANVLRPLHLGRSIVAYIINGLGLETTQIHRS